MNLNSPLLCTIITKGNFPCTLLFHHLWNRIFHLSLASTFAVGFATQNLNDSEIPIAESFASLSLSQKDLLLVLKIETTP